ncbi:uncharacterized protein LOC131316662 [Rhododendron vialii]|uniref:uncharacterized protein LOC131316662 n=1 Tax=Rhododendron vialii TaxID=182163 RepID=UPI00265ED6FC|nr:uncharacterized protein LOC131316662 [Rhododendron vialii]
MALKMDKALLAQLKAERAKQSFGAVAPKRKSFRLQKELNVDSFLDANLSNDPALDLVVEQIVEEEAERSKRKAKGAAVESTPLAKKRKASIGPSVLGNYQEALERASRLLSTTDKDLMAEMSLQAVGEQMLAAARGRYLTSQSHSLGKQVVTLTEANMKLTKQGATSHHDGRT